MIENILSMLTGGLLVAGGYLLCYKTNRKEVEAKTQSTVKKRIVNFTSPLHARAREMEERSKNSKDNGLDEITGLLSPQGKAERKAMEKKRLKDAK